MTLKAHLWLALSLAFAAFTAQAEPAGGNSERGGEGVVLSAAPELDLGALERWVQERAPEIEARTLDVSLASAEVDKSGRLPNPELELEWGTIPFGTSNPPDLEEPYANIPYYAVSISYTPPIGKRKARMKHAEARRVASRRTLKAEVRERALDVAELLGELATTELRLTGLGELWSAGKELVEVARVQVKAQSLPGIELDRLELDLARLEQQLLAARAAKSALLSECAAIVGVRCEAFRDENAARAFLSRWISSSPLGSEPDERPDLAALGAELNAAHAESEWARALKIPDPTIRFGYVHDRFLVSGNQQNSFNLSVSFPLMISDSGQAERKAALARASHLRAELGKRRARAEARAPRLRETLIREKARQEKLHKEILPKARAVLSELSSAADRRLVPMTDVILARRAVSESLFDEVESLGVAYGAALELIRELGKPKSL